MLPLYSNVVDELVKNMLEDYNYKNSYRITYGNPWKNTVLTENGAELKIPLAGTSKSDVRVFIEENNSNKDLIVKVKDRTITTLPLGSEFDSVEAEMDNGLLLLKINKKKKVSVEIPIK